MSTHYDLFVIGAGSGGLAAARTAVKHGAKVGMAEFSASGGTCVNRGCVPKKIMSYAAGFAKEFSLAENFGWDVKANGFDWAMMKKMRDERISRINNFFDKALPEEGIDVYNGFARFVEEKTITIDDDRITADHIIIATGGRPRVLGIEGGDLAATSDDFFEWDDQPDSVVILGAGYIAVEFAKILNLLGTHVTLINRSSSILRGFDEGLSTRLCDAMIEDGIDLQLGKTIEKITKDDALLHVHDVNGDAYTAQRVISAVGRVPNTDQIGLDGIGVETDDNGFVCVNDHYQTSLPHIYAIGDMTAGYHLTPVAIQEGRYLANRIFSDNDPQVPLYHCIPTVIFSGPPIGTIGLSKDDAKEAGLDFDIYETEFTPMKYSIGGYDRKTYMKLLVDRNNDRVIGCHAIGLDVDEMMQGFGTAMVAGATKEHFDQTIAIHPTSSEEMVLMTKKRD